MVLSGAVQDGWLESCAVCTAVDADETALDLLPVIRDIYRFREGDALTKREICFTLELMGGKAKAWLPTLVRALREEREQSVRGAVIKSLAAMEDSRAVPALLHVLRNDKDDGLRKSAAIALARFPSDTQTIVPALIGYLGASDAVSSGAIEGLRRIGKPTVPALGRALSLGETRARIGAAQALWGMGPAAADAAPELAAALRAPNSELRLYAAWALESIGEPAALAVPALTRTLRDRRSKVRVAAAGALRAIDPDNNLALPVLVEALRDPDPVVRVKAAQQLWWMEERAAPAVKPLIATLRDEDATVRWQAVHALGAIGPATKEVRPALRQLQARESDQEVLHELGRVLRTSKFRE
jgi:HEAT repeat protein